MILNETGRRSYALRNCRNARICCRAALWVSWLWTGGKWEPARRLVEPLRLGLRGGEGIVGDDGDDDDSDDERSLSRSADRPRSLLSRACITYRLPPSLHPYVPVSLAPTPAAPRSHHTLERLSLGLATEPAAALERHTDLA